MSRRHLRSLLGVLVDLSGSMRETYAVDSDLSDRSSGANSRASAVLKGAQKLLARTSSPNNQVFAQAIGIQPRPDIGMAERCDLLYLLEHAPAWACPPSPQGQEHLLELAKERGAFDKAKKWIAECKFENRECWYLYRALRLQEHRIQPLIDALPSNTVEMAYDSADTVGAGLGALSIAVGSLLGPGGMVEGAFVGQKAMKVVDDMKADAIQTQPAYKRAREAITAGMILLRNDLVRLETVPMSAARAAEVLHQFLEGGSRPLDGVEDLIYGNTPLLHALKDARALFARYECENKILLVFSDGLATDGIESIPSEGAAIRAEGVLIASCFLCQDIIGVAGATDKAFYSAPDPAWVDPGLLNLYEISSPLERSHALVKLMADEGWGLPPGDGPVRLFARVSTQRAVDEFCALLAKHNNEDLQHTA
eukprot:m.248078 g.248078  ORF g.248078 m.248078 type:complete len:424 (+) comp15621_c0_seq1:29-1300(+)